MISLARTLKEARLRLRLTQQQVADRAGVSRQAVTQWEMGKPIDADRLPSLSRILAVDLVTARFGPGELTGFQESEGKRSISCKVDATVLREAEASGTDVSQLLERALIADNERKRMLAWQAANREAIREANAELEQHGLWSDGLRLF